uniref:Uncharacterized protein n=1 Tax=Tanacetum cinerariifolium TaxID=118510 RepID=A0A6L2J6W9_TANCI|nr:hypothetical protein [Tanacetum cinerariifolium]
MVSFRRKIETQVGDGDFQDIRGVEYNDDFVIPSQAPSSTEDAINHICSKNQMSNNEVQCWMRKSIT